MAEWNSTLAGAGGIEPPHGGIKIRCLTAWLRPTSACAHVGRVRGGHHSRWLSPSQLRPRVERDSPHGLMCVRPSEHAIRMRRAATQGGSLWIEAHVTRRKYRPMRVSSSMALLEARLPFSGDGRARMPTKNSLVFVVLGGLLLGGPSTASAASFDCRVRGLGPAEAAICEDPQLSRTDEQIAKRTDAVARRMNYGQYLGLRHWQASSARQRNLCGPDRACISAHYRAQQRLLDRLQQCLDTRIARRSCLRNSLSGDQETMRR